MSGSIAERDRARARSRRARGSSPPTRAAARSRSASTRSAASRPRTAAARTARCCSRPRARPTHQRRDPLRRDDPPAGLRRPPLVRVLEEPGSSPASRSTRARRRSRSRRGEPVTDGLDGLRERLVEYRELGARFAKWRAVIDIGDGIPSQYCIDVNAHALARYAALCQDEGIVPIVEPEVLMDGDHSIEQCSTVTTATLHTVFNHARRAARRARRHGAQAQHGDPGQEVLRRTGVAGGGRGGDGRVLPRGRARRGARHRVPVRRPERRGGDRQPRRDQQARAAPVAALVLVRACAAARGAATRGRARTPTPPPARRRSCTAPA